MVADVSEVRSAFLFHAVEEVHFFDYLTLKMETLRFSEMSVIICRSI
jgi:hypothetical protein